MLCTVLPGPAAVDAHPMITEHGNMYAGRSNGRDELTATSTARDTPRPARAFLIGQAVRERRLALGLSQAQLATRPA